MKLRIVREDDRFYVEKKGWFFWNKLTQEDIGIDGVILVFNKDFNTMKAAEEFIQQNYFNKGKKTVMKEFDI